MLTRFAIKNHFSTSAPVINKIASISFSLILVGCSNLSHNPIPAEVQTTLVKGWFITENCYNKNQYSLDEHLSYQSAIKYFLNSWRVEESSINLEMVRQSGYVSEEMDGLGADFICQQWKPILQGGVNSVIEQGGRIALHQQRQHEIRANAPQTNSYSAPKSTFTKTINCKSINIMNSEVKTFSSGVCPVGWLPVSVF